MLNTNAVIRNLGFHLSQSVSSKKRHIQVQYSTWFPDLLFVCFQVHSGNGMIMTMMSPKVKPNCQKQAGVSGLLPTKVELLQQKIKSKKAKTIK